MTFNNIPSCGVSFQLLTGGTDGFSGSHAPAWEPIPELSSAMVCIPTQERGNEAVLSNGLPLDTASQWLVRKTGGFPLHGTAQTCGAKPSTVGYALRTLHSFAGFIQ
ncbi:hypothetical protein [Methylobacter sp.]|uniref:hypothetical protein n=1 Tax=Methylobacter sp. TaxID=2051955 RepID=UPI003DA5F461